MKSRAKVSVRTIAVAEDKTPELLHFGLTMVAFAASIAFDEQPAFLLLLVLSVAWSALFFAKNYHQQRDRGVRDYWMERTLGTTSAILGVMCVVSSIGSMAFCSAPNGPAVPFVALHTIPILLVSSYLAMFFGAERIKADRD